MEEKVEITTLDTGFSIKICGVEFGDISEIIHMSINGPLDSDIEMKCDLRRFVEKIQSIRRIENIDLKTSNQELRDEVGQKNLEMYHLQKENEALRNKFDKINKILADLDVELVSSK